MIASLLDLYDFAENNDIQVDSFDLGHRQSLSIQEDNVSYIAMNPMKLCSSHEEKVCLAHEIGHCVTGSFYNQYSPFDLRQKHETRANRWAFKALVSKEALEKGIEKGLLERWELAEYLDVPESFLAQAIEYYKICA